MSKSKLRRLCRLAVSFTPSPARRHPIPNVLRSVQHTRGAVARRVTRQRAQREPPQQQHVRSGGEGERGGSTHRHRHAAHFKKKEWMEHRQKQPRGGEGKEEEGGGYHMGAVRSLPHTLSTAKWQKISPQETSHTNTTHWPSTITGAHAIPHTHAHTHVHERGNRDLLTSSGK